jgi:hypothetical protein
MSRFFQLSALIFFSLFVASGLADAAGPGLEVNGSGFYGLSPSAGPFGRTFLSPQVTQVTPVATVRLLANGTRNEAIGFQYTATVASEGSVTYGSFVARHSFELAARPQTVTGPSGELTNTGHSELVAHLSLAFTDSGVVTSNTLPVGTPVALKFTVVSHAMGYLTEPSGIAPFNSPYPNDNNAGFDANGTLTVFDESSLAELNGALFLDNHVTVYTFNTAVGHRVDLEATNSPSAYAYAGYIGLVGSQLSLLFYDSVKGSFDATAEVFIEAPSGVSVVADSGHNYAPPATYPALSNISTRGFVGAGDNVMIVGLVVGGTGSKHVLFRALGPTLTQFGVTGALSNPKLELYSGSTLVASNGDWPSSSHAAQIQTTGLAPSKSVEAALLADLTPGNYTAIVRGENNATGVALVEAYDLYNSSTIRFTNISTRGLVQTGEKVLIAGIIVKGPTSQSVVVRGLGPTLGQNPFNVPNALANPQLEIRNADGSLLQANDDWKTTQQTQIQATGLAPPSDLEAAILGMLSPGNYTAILSGTNNMTGNALVEVYALN